MRANEIEIREDQGVLEIILNRPPVNALDPAISKEIHSAIKTLQKKSELRCAIFAARGRLFSAGWDLKAAATEGLDEDQDYGGGGFAGITEVFDLNKPIIAAVNGAAIGGGFEIVLACDIVVAHRQAYFQLPEGNVGVVADAGGVQRLPRRVPRNVANDVLFTGRRMGAEEAERHGLVNYLTDEDPLLKAREIARGIANLAPLSIQASKALVRDMETMSERDAFFATSSKQFATHVRMLESEDHEEGPRAFAEKRDPVWKGR